MTVKRRQLRSSLDRLNCIPVTTTCRSICPKLRVRLADTAQHNGERLDVSPPCPAHSPPGHSRAGGHPALQFQFSAALCNAHHLCECQHYNSKSRMNADQRGWSKPLGLGARQRCGPVIHRSSFRRVRIYSLAAASSASSSSSKRPRILLRHSGTCVQRRPIKTL